MFLISKFIALMTQPLVWGFLLFAWSLLWHGRSPRVAPRLAGAALLVALLRALRAALAGRV